MSIPPARNRATTFSGLPSLVQGMLGHYGTETGVRMARKHLGWYTRGLPGSAEFRNRVNFVDDPREVVRMLGEFYAPLRARRAA